MAVVSGTAAAYELQSALCSLGFRIAADGRLDRSTEQAIRVMQAARDLPENGTADDATADAIISAAAMVREAAVEPPRERWQWQRRAAGIPPGIYADDRFAGTVALTFDDGPSPRFTPMILDILAAAGVKATFYVQGVNASRWPEIVRRTAEQGHLIGNHTWDHPELAWLTVDAATQQIARTQATIRDIVGDVDCVVRPPYGSPFHSTRSPYAECWTAAAEALGRTRASVMMWHIDTLDWKYERRPEAIVRRFRSELRRQGGGIVLLHDVHEQSVWALPGILDVIRCEKMAFVRDADLSAHIDAARSA